MCRFMWCVFWFCCFLFFVVFLFFVLFCVFFGVFFLGPGKGPGRRGQEAGGVPGPGLFLTTPGGGGTAFGTKGLQVCKAPSSALCKILASALSGGRWEDDDWAGRDRLARC